MNKDNPSVKNGIGYSVYSIDKTFVRYVDLKTARQMVIDRQAVWGGDSLVLSETTAQKVRRQAKDLFKLETS